jgi:hypothetical protein
MPVSSAELAPWIERIKARRTKVKTEIAPRRIKLYQGVSQLLSAPRRAGKALRGIHPRASDLQLPWLPAWPGLAAKPFHDPRDFPWVRALEDATDDIRNEMFQVRDEFGRAAYDSDRNVKTWRTFYFYFGGKPIQEHLDACPKTREILRQIPTNKNHVCFSAIEPGGKLQPHTGPTNTSLTAHLGLSNCDGASICVAGETKTYEEGKVLILDDSFVHWVEHTGSKTRYTFMITLWHPELNGVERALLSAMIATTPQEKLKPTPNPLD